MGRWRPETSTLHLRVGEMTITLVDVVVLLDLSIDGASLSNPKPVDYMELCETLSGLSPPSKKGCGNEMIITTWFRELLADGILADASEIQIAQHSGAIILHIITSHLIFDHTEPVLGSNDFHF